MENRIAFIVSILIITSCSTINNKTFTGNLATTETIFEYSAIGDGIPCIAFTGSENIDKNLYPATLLEHINLIHANPDNIPEDIIDSLTIHDVIDDIEEVRKQVGLDKIAIMGHSVFGTLPLEYALKYPENVLFTITTGSLPAFNEESEKATEDYWESFASAERKAIYTQRIDSLLATDFESLSPPEQFAKYYIAAAPRYFYNPRFDCSAMWNNVSVNVHFARRYIGVIAPGIDNAEKYKTIDAPNLIISGKYDFVCPHHLWDGIVEEIPNATFVLFEKAGHNPMLESPDEFTKIVKNWMDSLHE